MSMVTEALDRLGIEYEVTRDEAFAHCPQHKERVGKEDSSPSWSINVESGLFYCFSCGYSGSLAKLVLDVEGLSRIDEAKAWLDSGEIDLPATVRKVRRASFRRALATEGRPFDMNRYRALPLVTEEFAKTRGLSATLCNDLGLRMRDDRWIIPIFNPSGILMGWQEKGDGVFFNVPLGVRKGMCLFGYDQLGEDDTPVVVESPLDAALAWQHSHPAVATFGSMVTDQQVELLSRFSSVTLAFDNDAAGEQATKSVGERLAALGHPWFRVVPWPEGIKDFGDAPERTGDIIKSSVLSIKFRMGVL